MREVMREGGEGKKGTHDKVVDYDALCALGGVVHTDARHNMRLVVVQVGTAWRAVGLRERERERERVFFFASFGDFTRIAGALSSCCGPRAALNCSCLCDREGPMVNPLPQDPRPKHV